MRKNKQSMRSLTAFLVTWAFFVLTVTGFILYIVPQGRVAYWVHWSLLGLEKDQWGWVHMMFGGVFIITGFLHLYFNWKPFKKYFADRVKGRFQIKQEIIVATILTIFIFAVSAANVAPASWFIDLNGWIKDSWITSPELEPPYGHAEEASLAGISRKMNFDLTQAVTGLKSKGMQFDGKKDTLDSIALKNNTTPMAIYEIIREYKREEPNAELASLSPAEIEEKFSGTGLGRKSIAEICDENGIELQSGLDALSQAGIDASADLTAREVAEQHHLTPIDLVTILFSGEK